MRLPASPSAALCSALLAIGGCAAVPSPSPVLSPSQPAASASIADDAAAREQAAALLDVDDEQLVATEDGFAATRFSEDQRSLQLLLAARVGNDRAIRLLASVLAEPLRENVSRGMWSAVVCPRALGLRRIYYLYGQEAPPLALELEGLTAVSDDTTDGTGLFAIAEDPIEVGTRWSLTHLGGVAAAGDHRSFVADGVTLADSVDALCEVN